MKTAEQSGCRAAQLPRIVRLKSSPVPLIGLVCGEDVMIHGMPAWIVQVYGYSLKTEAWLKSACSEPTTEIPPYIDLNGWLALAHSRVNEAMRREADIERKEHFAR